MKSYPKTTIKPRAIELLEDAGLARNSNRNLTRPHRPEREEAKLGRTYLSKDTSGLKQNLTEFSGTIFHALLL